MYHLRSPRSSYARVAGFFIWWVMTDEEYLAELIVARSKALQAQSYSIKDRAATRANLTEINNEIKRIERKIARTTDGGIRVRGVTPVG